MFATLNIGLTSENINFDYCRVDVVVPATSSTLHNKADCSKYIICQCKVEKLMLCVKTRDCGLNTIFENHIHLVYSFRKFIDFLSLW